VLSPFVSPDLAFLLVIIGALAIYWELHAPGMIAPGVLGASAFLIGVWNLSQDNPTWYGTVLITLALVLLAVEIKVYTHMISGFAGSVALAIGAILLIRGPHSIAPSVALPLALSFGIITGFLGTLAMRARRNKRMVGETLVDEVGSARTEINPEGTVFVRGEYWHARSPQPIHIGEAIYVIEARGMELVVRPLNS
jgi:membrane-bound serine protease (ClpP class)